MIRQTVTVKGTRYALVKPAELRRLEELAAKAEEIELPAWPPADAKGRRPAKEFARVSIARSIIEERRSLGLSQQDLAKLAGVRQETLSRLETGKHSPNVRTVDKIDRALKQASRKRETTRAKSATNGRNRGKK